MCKLCGDPKCHADEAASLLMAALLGGSMGGISPLRQMMGDFQETQIGVDHEGHLRKISFGTKTDTIPLSDIEGLDPDNLLIPSIEDYNKLKDEINDKTDEVDDLRQQVIRLENDISGRRIDLKFGISRILPKEHSRHFGKDTIKLLEQNGNVMCMVNDDESTAFPLDDDPGKELLEIQEFIEADDKRAREMRAKISTLELEIEKLPILLDRKKDYTMELFERIVEPRYRNDGVFEIGLGFDNNGQPFLHLRRYTKENTTDLSPNELADLRPMIERMKIRGEFDQLPESVRNALDSVPQIENHAPESEPTEISAQ